MKHTQLRPDFGEALHYFAAFTPHNMHFGEFTITTYRWIIGMVNLFEWDLRYMTYPSCEA
jgi:hypothetical protein